MRLWSVHPKYLDAKGIVALWRETLLAQAVLADQTKGYKNHPQLERFKAMKDPLAAIGGYLHLVHEESLHRGYHFNRDKILRKSKPSSKTQMTVTRGQLQFEWEHLKQKLEIRDKVRFAHLTLVKRPSPHPCFKVVPGKVEKWEKF